MTTDMFSGGAAVFSDCGKYRYLLTRLDLLPGKLNRLCLFVMLNPSTADSQKDDPTTRRCMAFARELGCDQYAAVNLFAYRSPRPDAVFLALDPVGPENDAWIQSFAIRAKETGGHVFAAWGVHGARRGRDQKVMDMLAGVGVTPQCIHVTKDGQPGHPLYVPGPWTPMPFAHTRGRAA